MKPIDKVFWELSHLLIDEALETMTNTIIKMPKA